MCGDGVYYVIKKELKQKKSPGTLLFFKMNTEIFVNIFKREFLVDFGQEKKFYYNIPCHP